MKRFTGNTNHCHSNSLLLLYEKDQFPGKISPGVLKCHVKYNTAHIIIRPLNVLLEMANMRDKSLSISMVQNDSIFGVKAFLDTLVPSLKKKINNLQANHRYFP